MSKLLFKLYNVPEDEADDVRQLLSDNEFDTYETHGGFFGMGVAAIWLRDAEQFAQARALIDQYQIERSARQRTLYNEQKSQGIAPSLKQKIRERPIYFFTVVIVIAAVIVVSFLPIWVFLGH